MSTKTLRKRIALVAVSAMGFGLLSAAPSSAVVGFASVANAGPVRANGSAVEINLTGSAGGTDMAIAAATDPVLYVNTTKPSGSTITFLVVADTTLDIDTGKTAVVGTIAVNASGTYSGYLFYDADNSSTLNGSEAGISYSFTTTGAATGLTASAASASVAAGIDNTITVNLTDATGALTQSLASEFVTVAATATGNVTLTDGTGTATGGYTNNASASVTAIFPFTDLDKGTFTFAANDASAGETVTVVITPSLALSIAGATAKTVTFTTIGASLLTSAVTTVATSTTSVLTTAGAANNAYTMAPSQTTVTFSVAGLEASKALTWDLTQTGVTSTIGGVAYVDGTDTSAIASSTGTLDLTFVFSSVASGDSVSLDLNTVASGQAAGQKNASVTWATPVYAIAVSAPTVAESLSISGSAVTITGTITDQYGNPLSGATVTATGVSVPAGSNKTASVASSTAGAFSITLPAAAAASTQLTIDTTAVKTGVGAITDGAQKVVNFSATGLATAVTIVAGDGSGTAVGNQTTTIPALILAADGVPSAVVVDEVLTIAAGTVNAGTDAEIMKLDSVSTPAGANITYTAGDSSVLLSTTTPTTAFTGSGTVTVQAGTDVFAWSNTPGTHSVVMTAGALTSTRSFHVGEATTAAARYVALSGVSTLANGTVGTYTATVTDAFGNLVSGVTTLTASVVGLGFINGSLTSLVIPTTGAAGTSTFSLVGANGGTGTVTVTVTGTGNQFAATAATGWTAGVASASSAVTITASTVKSATELAADAATAAATAAGTAAVAAVNAAAATAAATAAANAAALEALINDAIDMATEASSNADAAIAAAQDAIDAGDAANATAQDAADIAQIAADNSADAITAAEDATAAAISAGESALNAVDSADMAAAIAQEASDNALAATEAATAAGEIAQMAADSAAEAAEAALAAFDAAVTAGESADEASMNAAGAMEAAEGAMAAAENASTDAEAALDAALDAANAANAATEAANGARDAAEAATAAAQDATEAANGAKDAANAASDAVAALATSIATAFAAIKAQITALTNIIIKIQKKVKA